MTTAKQNALDIQVAGTHYKEMKIQPVEFIHANNIGFCEATAIKYLCRWRKKGGIEDLKKAKHFIDVLIELETRDRPIPLVPKPPLGKVRPEGPYCDTCEQLADFSRDLKCGDLDFKEAICSNCAVNKNVDTTSWDLLERL